MMPVDGPFPGQQQQQQQQRQEQQQQQQRQQQQQQQQQVGEDAPRGRVGEQCFDEDDGMNGGMNGGMHSMHGGGPSDSFVSVGSSINRSINRSVNRSINRSNVQPLPASPALVAPTVTDVFHRGAFGSHVERQAAARSKKAKEDSPHWTTGDRWTKRGTESAAFPLSCYDKKSSYVKIGLFRGVKK
jgi:hypothetical protein